MTDKPELDGIPEQRRLPRCLICGDPLIIRPSRSRKTGKPSIMIVCPNDGRHFRGWITYQPYVKEVMDKMEERGLQNEETKQ